MSKKITLNDLTYTGAPGHFLLDELEAADLTYDELIEALGDDAPSTREELLSGLWELSESAASKIEALLGSPARTWLKFERTFREGIASGKEVLNPERPEEKKASGKILLRVPASLHTRAVAAAKSEGISLNQLLLSYMAEGIARSEGKQSGTFNQEIVRRALEDLLHKLEGSETRAAS